MAASFLRETGSFSKAEIDAISAAIRYHSSIVDRHDRLLNILREADNLDAIGAVGLMRAFTSKAHLPDYDASNVKGETWELSNDGFTARFDADRGIGETIMDQINFQISYYDSFTSETAQRLGAPLIAYMKRFIEQLECEIAGEQPR